MKSDDQKQVGGYIKIMSFGFKFGQPPANHYFDVSFPTNPARQENWGLFAMVDPQMVEFILKQPPVVKFIDMVVPLIEHLATLDAGQVIAFGCNSGRHRSPIIADEIGARLAGKVPVRVEHRDLPEYESFLYEIFHGQRAGRTQ